MIREDSNVSDISRQRSSSIMSEFVWKKQEYIKEHSHRPVDTRCVMVIYSGGTLGMMYKEGQGYIPVPQYMEKKMKTYPMFNDEDHQIAEDVRKSFAPFNPLALPISYHKYRILYCINEYDPLLDSCNMNMEDWAKMARDIEQYYEQFDGFVIIHGTDTMCYTASALSFMLGNLNKPVVLTGAQVPLSELRNDARDNLLEALIMAGSGYCCVPEVTLYFNNKLLRGNRSTKLHSVRFDAFDSPNITPLATVGVHVTVHRNYVLKRDPDLPLKVQTAMCPDVGILKIFPGMTVSALGAFLRPPMKGVVLQTFGAGNAPSEPPLLRELKDACDRGMVIVNCTQCVSGNVSTTYPAAKELCELGVVSGADMTVEAALTKLSYLLGRPDLNVDEIRKLMARSLCGELTCTGTENVTCDDDDDDIFKEQTASISSLLCEAAADGDSDTITQLLQKGAKVNQPNYDGRTALHLACSNGHLDTVKLLIQHGASVHVQDSFHQTPLHNAIHFKRLSIIRYLLTCEASITAEKSMLENSSRIIQLAAADDVEGLTAWQEAGVDLAQVTYLGMSPLDAAQKNGALNTKRFLMSKL